MGGQFAERTAAPPQANVPATQITAADNILRELSSQSQRGREQAPQARQAIEAGEATLVAARGLAQSFTRPRAEGGLGYQPRHGTTVEQRRQEELTRLNALRERLVELRGHTFGDGVVDQNFRRVLDTQIGVVDAALVRVRGGTKPVTSEDVDHAHNSINQVQGNTGQIVEVATTVTAAMRAGLPPALARNASAALQLHQAGQLQRARLLLRGVIETARRSDTFLSQDGSGQLDAITATTTQLADTSTTMTDQDLARAGRDITNIMGGADAIAAARMEAARQAFDSQNRTLRSSLASETNDRMRVQLRDIIADNEAMLARLQRGSTNPPSEQELRLLSSRTLAVRSMCEDLARTPAGLREPASRIYGAALTVLDTPPTAQENADAIMGRFNTLMAASSALRMYPATSGARGREQTERRNTITREAQAVAEAETPQARAAAERQLTTTLATYVSRDIAAAAGAVPGEARTALDAIAAPLAQPGTATTAQVQAGMQALAAVGRLGDAISPSHRMDQDTRNGVIAIYARALTALPQAGGMEAFNTQLALAGRYAESPAQRAEIAGVSERAAQGGEGLQLAQRYLEADRQVNTVREQRRGLPAGSEAARALDIIVTNLEGYRTKIAAGQDIATEQQITDWTARIRRDVATDPRISAQVDRRRASILAENPTMDPAAAEAQAISSMGREMANASEQSRITTLLEAGEQMMRALQTPHLSGSLKSDLGRIFRLAIDAIASGNAEDGATYRDTAMTYLSLRGSRNARDRADIMQIVRTAEQATPEAGQARFTDVQIRSLQVYRQFGEYESRLTDRGQFNNARAYFDLALIAARGNDPRQFQAILDMANLYAGMSTIPESSMTPDLIRQRNEARSFVTGQLGDYSTDRSIRSGRRLLDLNSEGSRRWQVGRGVTLTPIARALVSTNAPATEEHPHETIAGALGNGNAQAGITELQRIAGLTNTHMQNMDAVQFEQRARTIEGGDEGSRTRTRMDRRYSREGTRLRNAAATAERAGDAALARYYNDQAELVDPQTLRGNVASARDIYRRSTEERALAARLSADALGAATPDAARERQSAEALIAQLPEGQRADFTRRLTEAGDNAGRVRAVYTDILIAQLPERERQQFTQMREQAGQLDLPRSRTVATRMISMLPEGMRAGYTERLQAAGENLEATRGIVLEIMHAQLAGGEAQVHAGRSMELRTQANSVLDGTTTLDRSVGLDTRRAESGRQELVVGIRTTIAMASGYATDLLGNVLTEPQGEGAAQTQVPVRAPPDAVQLQREQARLALTSGTRLVQVQEQTKAARDRGLASARTLLRDNNVTQSTALIERMIDLLPEGRRAEFRSRIAAANTRNEGESESAFRLRQTGVLQSTYTELGNLTGTRTTTDEGTLIYDTVGNYNDYRAVSGMFWSERFDAAGSAMNGAASTINIQAGRAGNWITHRIFSIQREASRRTGFPPGMDAVALALISPEGFGMAGGMPISAPTNKALDEIIGHLPADKRADYQARLARIRQQEGERGSIDSLGRMGILESLASENITVPSGRSVNLLITLASNGPLYYDAEGYDRRFADAQAATDRGNVDEANRLVQGLTGGRTRDGTEVVGDMEIGQGMESRDIRRFTLRGAAWAQGRARAGVRGEFIERAVSGEESRARQMREDRNLAIAPVLEAMEGSMGRSVSELNAAADANERARDEIGTNRSVLRVNDSLVANLYAMLPSDAASRYSARIDEMNGSGTTPARRSELAREIYEEMRARPAEFRQARDDLLANSGTWFTPYRAQLEADVQTTEAEGRHQQRTIGWTFARLQLTSMQDDLRMGDQAQTYREGRSAQTQHARNALDRAKGRPGQMYLRSDAHREQAARRAELALGMLDENNDYRAQDILRNNEQIRLPTYKFIGPNRDWNYASVGTYVTVLSDRDGRQERIGGRTVNPIDEMDSLNRAENMELVSYTDDDWFYESRDRVRPAFETIGQNQTDLQLALLGFRREELRGDPDGFTHRIVSWAPASEAEYTAVNDAYTQFMRLRGQMQSSVFQHDSPWGDDPQLAFLERTATRTTAAFNSVRALQPIRTGPIYTPEQRLAESRRMLGTSALFVQEGDQYVDRDFATREALSSMTNYRSGYNVVCGVGEFLVATAGVVFSPVTGGASLALTVGVGAMGVHRGFVMREQAGEWTGMATFSVVMGGIGMVLPVAGELAGGGRLLAGGVELAGELSAGSRGLTTLGRISSFGQRSATLERLVGTAETANWAQRYIGRTIIGATELNLAQRGVHVMGTGMMVGGFAQFGYQLPQMIEGVRRGDMAWFEAAFGGFQAIVQPMVQAGFVQYRVGQAARGGGVPAYRPAWQQGVEAVFLGHPLTLGQEHAQSLAVHNARIEFNALPQTARESYASFRDSTGIRLPPDVEVRVLREYRTANEQGVARNFSEFAAGSRDVQVARLETVREAVFDGRVRIADLPPEQQAYVRSRQAGGSEAAALTARDLAIAESRAPAPRTPETVAEQSRATLARLDRAAEMRDRRDAAAAAVQLRQERLELGAGLESNFTGRSSDGTTTTYTLGRGESAITFSEPHVSLATDLVFNAERIVRRPSGQPIERAVAEARTRIRAQLEPEVRANRMSAADAERITGERISRIGQMARDPEFVRATPRDGAASRSEQLRLGLESAGFLPEIASRPDVIRARNSVEVLRILNSRELAPNDLEIFAFRRQQQAEDAETRALGMETRAARLRESNPQSREATALDASAQRLRAEAAGLENSANTLLSEAAGRRSTARAGELRTRAERLEYRALLDQGQAEQLRGRAAGLRAEAERMSPQPARQEGRMSARAPDVPEVLANVTPERYAASALRNRALDLEQAAATNEARASRMAPEERQAATAIAAGYREAARAMRAQAEQFESGSVTVTPEGVQALRNRAGELRTEAEQFRTRREADVQRAAALERSGRGEEALAIRRNAARYGAEIAIRENEAVFLTREASNLETILRARSGEATRPAATPSRRTRAAEGVDESSPARFISDDAIGTRIIERALAPRDNLSQQQEWFVGGERVTVGNNTEVVTTRRVLQTVDTWVRGMARAGQESDIIVLSGDKRLLNNINNALGRGIGDRALSAYREVLRRAVNGAAGEGTPFLLRPSQSGDEVLAVIVVPRGRGQAVREALAAGVRRAEADVLQERLNPEHPESLAAASRMVRDPRGLVSAAVEIGDVVQVRRGQGGEITATGLRQDGSTYNAEVARTDAQGRETREIAGPALSRADDPRWGPDLRGRLGVREQMDITLGLEPLETTRVRNALARQRSGEVLLPEEQRIVAEVQRRVGDGASEDAAVFAIAQARATVTPTERVSGMAFEVRLEVTDPATLTRMRALLPESNKGLAELASNRFGIRGLNTFLGHQGSNGVVTSVEHAVGDFASSAYARQRGIRVRRLGTMKYIIEGGSAADMRMMRRMIDRQLSQDGAQMRMSRRTHHAQLTDVTGETALAHAQNGHLAVDRRQDPSRRSDWDGETRLYEMANSILSNISVRDEASLARMLGPEGYRLLRDSGVLDVVRGNAEAGFGRYANGSIRNFEDFVRALRQEVGGERATTMENAFRRFVIENEPVLSRRFATERTELSAPDVSGRIATRRQEIGQVYERRAGTLTPSEQQTVTRVDELVRSRGMSAERAMDYVADEQVRPHAVNADATHIEGEQRTFTAMAPEFQDTRVVQGDGSTVRLGDAPRGRLIGRLDDTFETSGSSAGVFRGEVLVNGQPAEVAIKLYRDPPGATHDQPATPARWRRMIRYAQEEVNSLRTLSEIRVNLPDEHGVMREVPLGPAVVGFVQVDGNPAIAMERVQGRAIDELTPSEIRRFVTPRTYEQLRTMWEGLQRAGYDIGDFQFAVLTSDQRVNGVQRRAGEIVFWDAGGLAPIARNMSPKSADYQVNFHERVAEAILISDYLWSEGPSGEMVPRRPQAEFTALDTALRGVLGVPADGQVTTADLLTRFRDMGTSGPQGTDVGFSAAQRRQAMADHLSRMPDRAEAARLETALRDIEAGSGVAFLPPRAEAAAAQRRTATAGAPAEVEETTTPMPPRPPPREPPAPSRAPTEGDRTTTTPPAEDHTLPVPPRQPPREPTQPPREPTQRPREPSQQREPTPEERADTEPSPPQARPPSRPNESAQLRPVEEVTGVPRQAFEDIRAGMAIPDIIDRLSQGNSAAARRLETAVGPMLRDTVFSERFRLASDAEKAMIVESLARGRAPADAFMDLGAQTAPRTAQEFESLAARLAALPAQERNLRLTEIRAANSLLADAVGIAAGEPSPQRRARLATEFETAMGERGRIAEVERARGARTPAELRDQEEALIRRAATDRGLDAEAAVRNYGAGGTEGRLNALAGLGSDVTRVRLQFQREQDRIGRMADGPAKDHAQQRLDRAGEDLFALYTRGNLQGSISGLPGFEGATVASISFLPGMRGVYEVRMSNNRRVFIKMEDVSAATFGRDLAATRGLYTSEIHGGFSYETGLSYRNGTPVRQEFGIIEDIHDTAGRSIRIRLPSGPAEDVRVVGVSMLRHEVLEVPRPPAAGASPAEVQAYQQRLARFTSDPVIREFYRLSGTPQGRETLMQAWNAYHELSRRSLLGDRYARNTAAILVERANGERVLTFQPIDMDAVGWRVLSNPDGAPNFMFFNRDFADASTDFIQRASSASLAAESIGLLPAGVPAYAFGDAMFSQRAQRPLPPEIPPQRQAGRDIIARRDGQPFGAGYDTTSGEYSPVGGTAVHGGRTRFIERADGRMRMYADEMNPLMEANLSPQARADYAREQQERMRSVRRRPGGSGGGPPPIPAARQSSGPVVEISEGQIIREPSAPAPRPSGREPSQRPDRTMDVSDSELIIEPPAVPPRRGPPPLPPAEQAQAPARRGPPPLPNEQAQQPRRGPPPLPARGERTQPLTEADVIPVPPEQRPVPPPVPPQARARGEQTGPLPDMTPVDLVAPLNLATFANRLAANDPAAVRNLAALPPQVRDTVNALRMRMEGAPRSPQEQAALAREFSGRVLATRLVADPETLWRFAANFRFGETASGVTPEQTAMLNSLPPSIRGTVLEFAGRLRSEWSARDALEPGFTERISRQIDVESVRDLYVSHRGGARLADPADRMAVEYITAGGRTPDPATREGARLIEAAAVMRSAARRLVEASGGSADVLAAARVNAETIRTGQRPNDFNRALAYDFINDLAQASAAAAGRGTPTAEDYLYATVTHAYFTRAGSPDTMRISGTHYFPGSDAIEQHVTATLDWGGQSFNIRIFRDRVNFGDVEPTRAVGEPSWPSWQMRDAFLRYAQRMLRGPLEEAVRPVMRAIPREAGQDARAWAAATRANPTGDIQIPRARPGRAPPAQASMTPEEIVRVHLTADTGGRAEAAAALMRMPPRDRARTVDLLRERARPLEERAGTMEAEARRLEAQTAPQETNIVQRQQAAEAEATRLFEEGRQLSTQAQAAEARGDAPEAARLRAEQDRIETLGGERDSEGRRLAMELGRLREPANNLRNNAAGLRTQAQYWNEHAMFYRELGSLSGDAGTNLSTMFMVPREELASIYARAPSLTEARQAIYDRLGIRLGELPPVEIRSDAYKSFTSLADDPYIAGMMLTGDLFRNIEQMVRPDMLGIQPGDRVVVRGISFQNGLVGAYRIRVEVVDSAGNLRTFTDRGGNSRSSMTVFAKRQDLRPDAVGSEGGSLTGAPTPQIRVAGREGNLSYTSPEGHTINYGIMRDIHDFTGEVAAGGHRLQVTVDAAEDLYSLVFRQEGARDAGRQELFAELRDNPDQFIEALGYAQTGFAAAGFYDRHEANVWAMWLRIGNQPPAEAARMAQSLRGQGYRVRENGDGSFSFLRFGAIDADTFGSYRATVREDDTISLRPMAGQLTTDLHRVFVHLTYEMNTAEMVLAASQGRRPRLLTVEQVIDRAFGSNMDGPWMRGMRRWATEFNPTTEQGRRFNDSMRGLLSGYHGQRSGMGFAMEGAQLGRFESDGYVPVPSALNGSPVTIVDGMDGRASFLATGRIATNPTIGESANRRIIAAIPEGQDRFLIRTDDLHRSQRTALRGTLGTGAQEFRTAGVGGRTYLVVSDPAAIPQQYLDRTISVNRTGDVLYSYNYGSFMTMFPEGRRMYMLRIDGLPRGDARAISRIRGARPLELGITGERRYILVENPDSIPQAFRDRAVEVVRHENRLMGADGIAANLGILHTRTIGAVRMFDHMMGMGDAGWTNLWQGVRDGILTAEGNERNAGGQDFLMRRVPQPNAQPMLPPEYGGPARTASLPPDTNPPGGAPPVAPPPVPPQAAPSRGPGGTVRGIPPPADAQAQRPPSQPPPPPDTTVRQPSRTVPPEAVPSDARPTAVRTPQPLPSEARPTTRQAPPPPAPDVTLRREGPVPPQAIPTDARPTQRMDLGGAGAYPGMAAQGRGFGHNGLPGRIYVPEEVARAGGIANAAAGRTVGGISVADGRVAAELALQTPFVQAGADARMRMALVAMDNASIARGELSIPVRQRNPVQGSVSAELSAASTQTDATGMRYRDASAFYDRETGAITAIGARGQGERVTIRVNMDDGRIFSVNGTGEVHPSVAALRGQQVIEPPEPTSGGPRRGPSGGGGPGGVRETAAMAQRVMSAEPAAIASLASASQETRLAVGFEIAGRMELTDSGHLANFARDLVMYDLHQSGRRPITNPADLARVTESARRLELLPEPIRRAVRTVSTDAGFGLNSLQDDTRFNRFVGNRRTGGALIETARGAIMRVMPAGDEVPLRMAVGAEDMGPRMPGRQDRPGGAMGMRGGDAPRAMAEMPSDSARVQPPPMPPAGVGTREAGVTAPPAPAPRQLSPAEQANVELMQASLIPDTFQTEIIARMPEILRLNDAQYATALERLEILTSLGQTPALAVLRLVTDRPDLLTMPDTGFNLLLGRIEQRADIINRLTGGDQRVMSARGLNYFDDSGVLFLDIAEITRRGNLPLPNAPPAPVPTAREPPQGALNRRFSTVDVKRIFEHMGYVFVGRTGENIMRHPDGRTASIPEAREVAGGTLNSVLQNNGITRRQFFEAARDAGVITRQVARQLLGE